MSLDELNLSENEPQESLPAEIPVEAPAAEETPAKAILRKPHIALRILLQLISFALSVSLFGAVLSGALLMDLREITSSGGIKKIINTLLLPTASAPVSVHPAPIQADRLSARLEEDSAPLPSIPGDFSVDENGNVNIGGGSVDLGDIPDGILTGGGSETNVLGLVDWFYDQIDQSSEAPMPYSKEEMRQFIQESTVSDYLSDKLAGYAEDFINGTESTQITSEEVMGLLKENEDLMKDKLNMELTPELWTKIEESVGVMVEKNDINVAIRDTVYEAVDGVLEENSDALGGAQLADIQALLQRLISNKLFFQAVGGVAVLLALLCLANFYNVPAGLTWAAIPTVLAGAILSAPISLLRDPTVLSALLPAKAAGILQVAASFVDVFAPIHYGVLGIGIGLLVISILWRIIRRVIRKRQAV